MTLLSALQKISLIPESVIATRDGEMILDDEILKDGDVVKLIAVISGGSCRCEGVHPEPKTGVSCAAKSKDRPKQPSPNNGQVL